MAMEFHSYVSLMSGTYSPVGLDIFRDIPYLLHTHQLDCASLDWNSDSICSIDTGAQYGRNMPRPAGPRHRMACRTADRGIRNHCLYVKGLPATTGTSATEGSSAEATETTAAEATAEASSEATA